MLPQRRSIRIKSLDYSRPNAYFITICCDRNRRLFGDIDATGMHRNLYGNIAYEQWLALVYRYSHITLGEFIIMPNHMHGVIYIGEPEPDDTTNQPDGDLPTLGNIIGAYKSLTYRACLQLAKTNNERLGKIWLRNYYEILIRTPDAARRIRTYILNNVQTWKRDKFYGG